MDSPAKWFQTLRQRAFPSEFRIESPVWDIDLLPELERLLQMSPPAVATEGEQQDELDTRFAANLGTGVWRLKGRMVESGTGEPLEGMHRLYRHLESVLYTLSDAGIQIQDHTGDPFNDGLALKVLTFQPMLDINREQITETIKPSIYYKGKLIQVGEVIVGRPLRPGETL